MRINLVCTGNICRSPTAHWMLVHKLRDAGLEAAVEVVSSGTAGHTGWPADERSARVATKRGFPLIAQHRAERLQREDYTSCDLLLALDAGHLDSMRREAPAAAQPKLRLLCDYAQGRYRGQEVPDPYYDDTLREFELVADMIDEATDGLLLTIMAALEGDGDPCVAVCTPAVPAQGAGGKGAGAR